MIGWLVAFGVAFGVVYGPYSQYTKLWGDAENIIYGILFRLVWALALAWVIYACHNEMGGKITLNFIVPLNTFSVTYFFFSTAKFFIHLAVSILMTSYTNFYTRLPTSLNDQ